MELQPRSESSTCESSIDPGYNPKYSVRLSLTTSSVFPNYHSPDSLKPSPQEKPFPSPSRLFLFLAKPIDEKKSQQHQKKSHQKQQKTHKPRHASTRPTTFSSNNSLVDRRTSRLSSTSFWPRSSRPCALLGGACDHGLAKLSYLLLLLCLDSHLIPQFLLQHNAGVFLPAIATAQLTYGATILSFLGGVICRTDVM